MFPPCPTPTIRALHCFSTLLRVGALRVHEKAVLAQIRDLAWAVYPEPEAGVRMHMPHLPFLSVGEQRPEAGLLPYPDLERGVTGELSPSRVLTFILCWR